MLIVSDALIIKKTHQVIWYSNWTDGNAMLPPSGILLNMKNRRGQATSKG